MTYSDLYERQVYLEHKPPGLGQFTNYQGQLIDVANRFISDLKAQSVSPRELEVAEELNDRLQAGQEQLLNIRSQVSLVKSLNSREIMARARRIIDLHLLDDYGDYASQNKLTDDELEKLRNDLSSNDELTLLTAAKAIFLLNITNVIEESIHLDDELMKKF